MSLGTGSYYLNSYTTIQTSPYGVYQAITWPSVNGIELAGQGMGQTTIVCNFGDGTNYYIGIDVNRADKLHPGLFVAHARLYYLRPGRSSGSPV